MTDSFGASLRRERERRNISVAQIAASTKIQASLFHGLERDDVSKWPSGIFRRAFIRAYAEAIGLDADSVCRDFVQRFPETVDDDASRTAMPSRAGLPAKVGRAAHGNPGLSGSPGSVAPATDSSAATSHDGLRLTLAEQRRLLPSGPAAQRVRRHWRAAALDVGIVLIAAISTFIVLDAFWMPLAIASVLYYLGGTLLHGSTPGVAFFTTAEPVAPVVEPIATAANADVLPAAGVSKRRGKRLPFATIRPPVDIARRRARA